MNLFYGKKYRTEPLLYVIDTVINRIRTEYSWGYAVEYYLSSINQCSPIYASHFYNKHMLPIDQVAELLNLIREDKKISFDKEYAEQLYLEYNARREIDDSAVVNELRGEFEGKRILLIAPGRSITEAEEDIRRVMNEDGVISISLNHWELFETDYVFVTRHEALQPALNAGKKVITATSVTNTADERVHVIDYQKWILVDGEVQDSSGIMVLNLLKACGVSEILLAGFDGFHVNVSKNYYDKGMNHPITAGQAKMRNEYFAGYIAELRKQIPSVFLTESLYEAGNE